MKGWMYCWLRENMDYLMAHTAEEINKKLINDCYKGAIEILESFLGKPEEEQP